MKVTALPKHVRERNRDGLMFSDSYLTDGTFLINKKHVKESFKYYNQSNSHKKRTDSELERLIDSVKNGEHKYKITNRLFDCGNCYQREFVCDEKGDNEVKKLYLNEGFVKQYDLQEVVGSNDFSPVSAFAGALIIMPMRGPDYKVERR